MAPAGASRTEGPDGTVPGAVADQLEQRRAEADERQAVRLFTRAASDRTGLLEFMAESTVQVEAVAQHASLAAESCQDLVNALFADGLSTRGAVTEISGRGFGLGAARRACHDLGGKVELDSTPGVGTPFRFIWPTSASGRGPATTSQSHAELPQAEVSQI